MSIAQEEKKRKPKGSKGQTLARRREQDRARRERERPRAQRRKRDQRHDRFRVEVVRYYRRRREKVSAQEAVAQTLDRYRPTEAGHFPLCASSIRAWHRRVGPNEWGSLRIKSSAPHTIHSQAPDVVVSLIFMRRVVLGWGGLPPDR